MFPDTKRVAFRQMIRPVLLVPIFLFFSTTIQASTELQNNIDQLIKTNSCVACNLQGADLNRMDLTGADLRDANLNNASLYLANLSSADLRGAHLRDAKLGGADLANADLRGADLQGTILSGAYLVGTRLDEEWQREETAIEAVETSENAQVSSPAGEETPDRKQGVAKQEEQPTTVSPEKETVPAPSAEAPREKRVDPLPPANLEQSGANIQPKAAPVSETAPVSEAAPVARVADDPAATEAPKLPATTVPDEEAETESVSAEKTEAPLDRLLESRKCYQCDLAGVDLQEKNLDDVDLEQSDLSGASLRNARFRGANLKGVSFRNADLRGADLREADLYKADFTGADVTGSVFDQALLDEAIFAGSVGYTPPEKSE